MALHSDKSSAPNTLLTEFLNSGRSDAAFRRVVDSLAGLVYGSAFRRTGDSQLAEEITQNVFTILAQKADSLVHHKSLVAWIHVTTRYESAKALRSEARRRRRLKTFAQESMESNPSSSVDFDLELLEKALDHLSHSDRELILARFYQGKKFREIAQQTNRTEAACKVQLRRVLDRMSTWLKHRGHALSITALMALLSSELTKAAPLGLSSNLISVAKVAPLSSGFSPLILSTLVSMKISHLLALGAVAVILFVGVPLAIHSANSSPSQGSVLAATRSVSKTVNSVSHSDRRRAELSAEHEFYNHPYAHARLEELYAMYPNLRRASHQKPEGLTIADEIIRCFEGTSFFPKEIREQIKTNSEWDHDLVGSFLVENEELIASLIEASEYSSEYPRFVFRVTASLPEVMKVRQANGLLLLSMQYAMREGDQVQAEQSYRALTRLGESVNQGTALVSNLVWMSTKKRTSQFFLKMLEDGYQVNSLRDSSPFSQSPATFAEALRTEFSTMVSLMESFRYSENKVEYGKFLGSALGTVSSDDRAPSRAEGEARLREVLAMDIGVFEEAYAEVLSGFVSALEKAEQSSQTGDWSDRDRLISSLQVNELNQQDPQDFLMQTVLPPRTERIPKMIYELDSMSLAIDTLDVVNHARADGLDPVNLQELVPNYFEEVPRHLVSQEPINPASLSVEDILEATR